IPRWLTELRGRLSHRIRVVDFELVTRLCRRGFTLRVVIAFVLLKRAARVEQSTEELLLTRDSTWIETAAVERVGELLGFFRHLRCTIAAGTFAHLVELLCDLPLLARERTRRRLH